MADPPLEFFQAQHPSRSGQPRVVPSSAASRNTDHGHSVWKIGLDAVLKKKLQPPGRLIRPDSLLRLIEPHTIFFTLAYVRVLTPITRQSAKIASSSGFTRRPLPQVPGRYYDLISYFPPSARLSFDEFWRTTERQK